MSRPPPKNAWPFSAKSSATPTSSSPRRGGTGAEDLALKIDKKDYSIIRKRRPLFIGFSDFTFLLSEIYYRTRVPLIYFPSLKLGKGNFKKILSLIKGEEIQYQGSRWLTPPPERSFSGIPIGGNLTTFLNFLNRQNPPRFSWARHILFIEDVNIDVEDLHRLMAALRRHQVLDKIKGLVVGSLNAYNRNHNYRKNQKDALRFLRTYLTDVHQGPAQAGQSPAHPGRLEFRPQHRPRPDGRPHRRPGHASPRARKSSFACPTNRAMIAASEDA